MGNELKKIYNDLTTDACRFRGDRSGKAILYKLFEVEPNAYDSLHDLANEESVFSELLG